MIQIAFNTSFSKKHSFELKVDIHLENPAIIGIIGDSGSGKTTFFKILSGLTSPNSGAILVNGKPWYDSKQKINIKTNKRSCSYLFQEATLFTHLTVLQNILFANNLLLQQEIDEWLGVLELIPYKNQYPNQLSGGQQKRVALIISLVQESCLVLLDEPFVALDKNKQKQVADLIRKVCKERSATFFIASHQTQLLSTICDITYEIKGGVLDIKPPC